MLYKRLPQCRPLKVTSLNPRVINKHVRFDSQLLSSEDEPTPYPGSKGSRERNYAFNGGCPLLRAWENELATDIELQTELKGLSKLREICEHEMTHKCVWLRHNA